MRPKVFVSRVIPDAGLKLLRKECDVEVNLEDRSLSKHELIQGVSGKDAIITLFDDAVDVEVLNSNPNLRVVSNFAVGFNNVDLKLATKKQIAVTNTPDVSTDSIADFAIGLMLSVSRNILHADKYVKEGKYKGWSPSLMLGTGMSNKTLGIVGLGSTGKALAQRASGFNMKIIYYDVLRNKEFEQKYNLTYCSLKDLLKESDFVSLHVPLLPQTKHLIGVKELNIMKKTAYLINTARGSVVDQEALVHALKHKVIAGAALDVFENEPKLKLGEKNIPNLVLTPHIASATKEARNAMAVLAAKNVLNVLKGKKPESQVNKKVLVGLGYKHPFYMVTGKIVKNKEELITVLENSSDHDYWYHANHERNDFANWIKDVLKNVTLSDELRKANDRIGAIKILKKPVKKVKATKKRTTKRSANKKAAKRKEVQQKQPEKLEKKISTVKKVVKKPTKKKATVKKIVKKPTKVKKKKSLKSEAYGKAAKNVVKKVTKNKPARKKVVKKKPTRKTSRKKPVRSSKKKAKKTTKKTSQKTKGRKRRRK